MLSRSGLAHANLRVLAAAPMNRDNDVASRLIDVGDDVDDLCTHQLLARTGGHGRGLPGGLEVLRQSHQIAARYGNWTGLSRLEPTLERLNACGAASQFFSSCAAISRFSGSQEAYRRSANEAS